MSEAKSPKQGVKLVSIPSFRKARSFVLLDMETLGCYEYKFEISNGLIPQRDSVFETNAAQEDV